MHTLPVQESSRRTSCLCGHCLYRTFADALRRLYLSYHATRWVRGLPPEPEIPREVWYMLLRPFCHVKKLQLDAAITTTRMLSFALCPEDGPPVEGILPKLCKISRRYHARFGGMLDPFIAARRGRRRPISKRRRPPNSDSESDE
jgi:hypothetical protein